MNREIKTVNQKVQEHKSELIRLFYDHARTKACSDLLGAITDDIKRLVLNSGEFYTSDEDLADDESPERITDPRSDFRMSEDEHKRYWGFVAKGQRERGIRTDEWEKAYGADYCPALVANRDHIKVCWKIQELFGKITGVECPSYGKSREDAIELMLGLASTLI